jgi:hypothetical protein
MAVITEYAWPGCDYHADVHEGAGFVVGKELRRCHATDDLVGVTVSVHGMGVRRPPGDLPLAQCP